MTITEQTIKDLLKAKAQQKVESMFVETASTLLKGEDDKEALATHTQDFIKIPKDQESKPLDKKVPVDSTPLDDEPSTMHLESMQSLENLAAQIQSLKFLRRTAADKGDTSAAEVFDNQISELRTKRKKMMSESATADLLVKNLNKDYHKVTLQHPETKKETVLKVFNAHTDDHAHMAATDHMPKHKIMKVERISENMEEMPTNQKDSEVKKNLNRFLNTKEEDKPVCQKTPDELADHKEGMKEPKNIGESMRQANTNPYILGNQHADDQHPHNAALDRKTPVTTSVDPNDMILDAAGKAVEAGGKVFADKMETTTPDSAAKANVTANLKIRNADAPPKKKVDESSQTSVKINDPSSPHHGKRGMIINKGKSPDTHDVYIHGGTPTIKTFHNMHLVKESMWMVQNTHTHPNQPKNQSSHKETFDVKEPDAASQADVTKDVEKSLNGYDEKYSNIKITKESAEDPDQVMVHDPLDMMRKNLHGKIGRITHKSSGFGNHVHLVQIGDKEHAIDRGWLRPVNEEDNTTTSWKTPQHKYGAGGTISQKEDPKKIKVGDVVKIDEPGYAHHGKKAIVHNVSSDGAGVPFATLHGKEHEQAGHKNHFALHTLVKESIDESATHYHSIFVKNKDDKEWNHHFDADNKSDAADEARSQRNSGYKVKTLRVPKDQADWRKPEHMAAARAKLNEDVIDEANIPSLAKLQNQYRRGQASLNDLNEALSLNAPEIVEKHMKWREKNLLDEDMVLENSIMKMAGTVAKKVKDALKADPNKIHTQEFNQPDTGSTVVMHTMQHNGNTHRIFHLVPTKHAHYTKNGHFTKPDETHKAMKKALNKDYLYENEEEKLDEHIVKQGSKYVLKSKKSGKHLRTFDSHEAAVKREQQIEYFKHQG